MISKPGIGREGRDGIFFEERSCRTIEMIHQWLRKKGDKLGEKEFKMLWKGLFYAIWMCDKMQAQKELCER